MTTHIQLVRSEIRHLLSKLSSRLGPSFTWLQDEIRQIMLYPHNINYNYGAKYEQCYQTILVLPLMSLLLRWLDQFPRNQPQLFMDGAAHQIHVIREIVANPLTLPGQTELVELDRETLINQLWKLCQCIIDLYVKAGYTGQDMNYLNIISQHLTTLYQELQLEKS